MALSDCVPITVAITDAVVRLADIEVLSGVTLRSSPGEIIALIGPNGAGKSTLLSALARLVPLSAGHCACTENDGTIAAITRIGYVLQKPVMLRRSVGANIDFAMTAAKVDASHRQHLRNQLMGMLHIDSLEHIPAYHLSQGERQRLAVARVLAMRPGVLMMDEATNSLDQMSSDLLEHHIRKLADRGLPVFWVTHSLAQAERMADRVVRLEDGRITDNKKADEFFKTSAGKN
jgi:tungstate transport system ATP-binding protein